VSERNANLDALKRYDLNNDAGVEVLDTLLDIVNNYQVPPGQDKTEAAKIYLSKSDFAKAVTMINDLRTMGGYDSYCDYMEVMIGLKQSGGNDSTLAIDSIAMYKLQSVANDKTAAESGTAEELLRKLQGQERDIWIEPNEFSDNRRMPLNNIKSTVSKDHRLVVYPNPASNEVNVLFNLPQDVKEGLFTITDVTGRKMASYQIFADGKLTINTTNYAKGIYFCTLRESEITKVIDKIKLVIIN